MTIHHEKVWVATRKVLVLPVLTLILLVSLSFSAQALSREGHGELAQKALKDHIRPSYKALVKATDELETALVSFCAKPSPAARSGIEQNFEKTLLAWSRIDHIRFGPISRHNRIDRMIHWPDHKGIGLRQVKKVLRTGDKTVLSPASLKQKSVALQGLSALEYLLFGTDNQDLAKISVAGTFRCSYAVSISKNLFGISKSVVREWGDDRQFVKDFLQPHENSDFYITPQEVTRGLFISFLTELKIVDFLKLGRPLGKKDQGPRPKRAAFWRSHLSFKQMDANMGGVRSLFNHVFSDLVANSDPGVEEGVDDDFEQFHRDVLALKMPITKAVLDKQGRAKMINLRRIIELIKRNAGRAIITGADLSMGFNALDGD